ncbi:MAG: hemolysin XhlA family protein [Synergistaceae bacterium]|nr:hemolysin XhlA family protein [Synergistaceae bacterium]
MITQQKEAPSRLSERVLGEARSVSFVEEKVFSSEIKRLDSDLGNIKKSVEKQDDKFTRAIEKLEANLEAKFEKIDQRFEKIEQRFEKMDQRFIKLEDKLDSNFKWLVGIYIPLTGIILAAFYAFATYIKQ